MASAPRRSFCIVLTNNPRLIDSARRKLPNLNEQSSGQQMQPSQVASEIQTRSRTRQQQEGPTMNEYEKTIEENFQNHIKQYLQLYMQQTRRSDPINCVFDMSNCFQNE